MKEREFVAYFIARQTGLLAFSIEDVAVSWQIFSLRHSPLDLGLVGLVLFLPQLVLAIPAGVLADRADRRSIIIASSFTEAVGLAGFIALMFLDVRSVGVYLGAVAFIGIAHSMGIPAQRALLVNIVPKEQFVRAQALTSSIGQLVNIGGPALGGVLIAISTPVAFAAAAIAYILATAAFTFLKRHTVEYEDVPVLQAALQGVRFIMHQRIILGAISLDLFAVLFGGATALLPVFATTILQVGATGFGLLRAAPAVGAAAVAGYVARHSLQGGAGRLLLICVAGFGAATIVFGLSRNFIVSIVALVLTGAFDMVSVVIRSALVQLRTPNEMRGRVGAVENVFIGASNELGAFESGGVAALIGTQASVVLGGAATLAVIALWTMLFPELRQFEVLEQHTSR
ncbi:MAG TPA: MFS transporter [Candidatus Baltobacteraceae bacterium]|nr:MFS transporter [Candidatus Baltobacteraceae bacterium]